MNMKKQEDIPARIRDSGKNLPFRVPDNYFEELPGRIQERIQGTPSAQPLPQIRKLRPALALAAMFIGLIAVGYAGFQLLSDKGNNQYLSGDELFETMEYLVYDFDEELLRAEIIESGISMVPESPDIQTDEIIQVLSEDDIDFTELLEDL